MPRFFETASDFGQWLAQHGAIESELIVGFYKRETGRPSMTWPESVDEALCVGWIDGVRTRIDDASYKIRFTRRKPTSIWSAINIDKVAVLKAAGRMQPAGLEAFERRQETRSKLYSHEQRDRAELEPVEQAQFKKNRKAWTFFGAQPPGYRHRVVWHIHSAKRPETRSARLARLIDASARKVRL